MFGWTKKLSLEMSGLNRVIKTVLHVNHYEKTKSYIGFLNQKSFKCELFEVFWQNSEEAFNVYKLLFDNILKNICIVWNNASDHKSIKYVWNTIKQHLANIQHETLNQSKQVFCFFIEKLTIN